MGVAVSTKYIEAAKEYSELMWKRSFGGLRFNDKALAILLAKTLEITEMRKVSAKEADEKKRLKRALLILYLISHIFGLGCRWI